MFQLYTKRLLVTGLFCLLCAASASADPIALTITRGLAQYNGAGRINTTLTDSTGRVTITYGGVTGISFTPIGMTLRPGQTGVRLSFATDGSDTVMPRIFVDGVQYRYDGLIAFDAAPLTIPTTLNSQTIDGTFTLNGLIFAQTLGSRDDDPPVFSFTLAGTGQFRALLRYFPDNSGGLFQVADVRYEAPVLTPEPATMILLGTGLAGVALKRRRRTKDA